MDMQFLEQPVIFKTSVLFLSIQNETEARRYYNIALWNHFLHALRVKLYEPNQTTELIKIMKNE